MKEILPSHIVNASDQAVYLFDLALRHVFFARTKEYPTNDQLKRIHGAVNDLLTIELTESEGLESRARARRALHTLMFEEKDSSPESNARKNQARATLRAEVPEVYR